MSAFGLPAEPDGCPCGSGRAFAQCCRPVLLGQRTASCAQELMRSRYCAFATGDAGYLLRSWHPLHRPDDLRLDPTRTWVGLDILGTEAGGPRDEHGVVEYRAHSRSAGRASVLHERSRFERFVGAWVYTDGTFVE